MSECCSGGTRLIYACSGVSDAGQVTDKAARKLSKEGFGSMVCLSAVGAHLSGFVQSALGADENIVIDGCPVACGRKILEHTKVTPKSFILTEMGFEKGKTKVSDETVSEIAEKIKDKNNTEDSDDEDYGGCDCGGVC